jgi:hypothetical protein
MLNSIQFLNVQLGNQRRQKLKFFVPGLGLGIKVNTICALIG